MTKQQAKAHAARGKRKDAVTAAQKVKRDVHGEGSGALQAPAKKRKLQREEMPDSKVTRT